MNQITQLRCDRCGKEAIRDNRALRVESGWCYSGIGLDAYDFCPACWKEMLALANVKPIEDTQ
jgi:hypothetical protein